MNANGNVSLYAVLKSDVFLRPTSSSQEALAYQQMGYQVVDLSSCLGERLLRQSE
ncbi:MAG: hypothetical protein ACRDEA_03355 [Microcystaceae cyanobacterium]